MFTLRAAVMWTMNDFPAYAMVSGWSTNGYMACPVCKEDVTSGWHARKVCYLDHRRWLPWDHEWREKDKEFDGNTECRLRPREWSGDEILEQPNRLDFALLGKTVSQTRPSTHELDPQAYFEMIFPPAFFTSMMHVMVHLPEEALLAGPVNYRWMYPIERLLGELKKSVRNRAKPEGSTIEAWMSNLIRRRRAVTTAQSSEPPAQLTSAATALALMDHLAVGHAGSQAPASSAS
ncbi:hypothetical protein L3X38_037367 [Prunus dulcis]|uniref:DUF4218 domain-containing protein n=1 Tax=Prunus dulcis TaxID=3755 RepID=A0AAD4V384_PRUDU|nr:hypothetical protein L3X38_037367 [Prunus dulcis]